MNGEDLPTTEEFTYLDSAVRHNGGARNDIKAEKCLQNAQQRVEVLSIQHQDLLKIYQGCVMSSLLYGSECWRMTESVITKLSVFHTEPQKNPANLLARYHLQHTATRPLQSRQHVDR